VSKVGSGPQARTVATVQLAGPLMKAVGSMQSGTSTVQARRDLRQAAADPDVSAILLMVDSPGGTVAGTQDLAADVAAAAAKKPVWAFIDDLGASAAYWVASQATKVFANAGTAWVGSIGTLLVVYDVSGAAEEAGVKALVFGTGPLKGVATPGTVVTDDQQAYFKALVEDTQRSFDAAVAGGRGMTPDQLAAVKTGGAFLASDALRLNLIDGIQSIDQTLAQLAASTPAGASQQPARAVVVPALVPQQTTRVATAPVHTRSVAVNEFEKFVAAQGFDPKDLSETQAAFMRAMFEQAKAAAQDTFAQFVAAQGFDPKALTEAQAAFMRAMFEGQNKAAAQPATSGAAGANAAADFLADMRAAAAAEAKRVAAIQKHCANFPGIAAQAIAEGWTAEKAENAALKAALPTVRPYNPVIVSRSHETECTAEALMCGLILRAGCRLDDRAFVTDGAVALEIPQFLRADINDANRNRFMELGHRYRSMSAIDLCKEALRIRGIAAPDGNPKIAATAVSSGALTSIFTTNVNAVLLSRFMSAPDTTAGWTRSVDVADYKLQERPRMKKIGGPMRKRARGAKAEHLAQQDQSESYKVFNYADTIIVDEQDLVDDRLGGLSDTPTEMADLCAQLRPDLVYAILLANPSLAATARALFNATDGNLLTGVPLTLANLQTAIQLMACVQENGRNLNLKPTHLVVPQALRMTAKNLLNSTIIVVAGTAGAVTEQGNANVLTDEGLVPVSDSRLDNGVTDPNTGVTYAGSTTDWYLASTMGQTIEVGYLRGTGRVPRVRSYVLDRKGEYGLGWDVDMTIGAKAMEWRTLRKQTP
jgi:signal peptide peptidase SppA